MNLKIVIISLQSTVKITDCRLPIADCRLPTADCRLINKEHQ